MIARPSCKQLLECVRQELRTTIASAVAGSQEALAALAMIDWVIASVIVRSDDEVAWIYEEISAIEAAAGKVIHAGADPKGLVGAALEELHRKTITSHRLPELHHKYNLAGEVLSCALEAALQVGGQLLVEVEAVLENRLQREMLILGDFKLPGRG